MTTRHDVHVVAEADSTGWKVKQGRRDGRIRSKDSYGNEGSTRDTEP